MHSNQTSHQPSSQAESGAPILGLPITCVNGALSVPDRPIIPCIPGDGIGPEIWAVTQLVLETAIEQAYQGRKGIDWILIGSDQIHADGGGIHEDTLKLFVDYRVGIKGPLTTPVGKGFRSLNVALRKALDLYACVRPVKWIRGVPAPVLHPELMDMVVFRENTEDLYAGIEFEQGSLEVEKLLGSLRRDFPDDFDKIRFPDTSSIGIKPISRQGSQRLARAAIRWALENQRKSVTLVHKGNIMKFTEGNFRKWGYEVARREFGEHVYTMEEQAEIEQSRGKEEAERWMEQAQADGKLLVRDMIADAMFASALSRTANFDVLATTNLNGDYLSDALAAQVGGLGIAPGANINYETGHAIFEATHGSVPYMTGMNRANPCSLILSGEMMLRYLGWNEAADLLCKGVENTIAGQILTADFHAHVPGSTQVSTSEFGEAVVRAMKE